MSVHVLSNNFVQDSIFLYAPFDDAAQVNFMHVIKWSFSIHLHHNNRSHRLSEYEKPTETIFRTNSATANFREVRITLKAIFGFTGIFSAIQNGWVAIGLKQAYFLICCLINSTVRSEG